MKATSEEVMAPGVMLKVAVVAVLPLAVALHPGSGRAGWRGFKKRNAPLFASSFDTDSAVADVKARLMQLVEPLDRGFGASEDAKQQVRQVLGELEALGPSVIAAERVPMLQGRWRLVFSDAPDIVRNTMPLGPLSAVGEIRQEIGAPDMGGTFEIANIIEVLPPEAVRAIGSLPVGNDSTEQRVLLDAQAAAPPSSRVELTLRGSELRPKTLLGQALDGILPPLRLQGPKALALPFGSFDIIYVDDTLRVVRTNQGYWGVNVRDDVAAVDEDDFFVKSSAWDTETQGTAGVQDAVVVPSNDDGIETPSDVEDESEPAPVEEFIMTDDDGEDTSPSDY